MKISYCCKMKYGLLLSINIVIAFHPSLTIRFERTFVNYIMSIWMLINKKFGDLVHINLASIRSFVFWFIKFPKVLSTYHFDVTSQDVVVQFGVNVKDMFMFFNITILAHPNQGDEEYWSWIELCSFFLCGLDGFFFSNQRFSCKIKL